MIRRTLSVLALTFMLPFVYAYAQEDVPTEGAAGTLQAPSIEPSPVTGEPVEPDITIKDSGKETVYEYRVKGVLYMVKVQPQIGPVYYLYDLNGDGLIDAQDRSPKNTAVPQWILFQWH